MSHSKHQAVGPVSNISDTKFSENKLVWLILGCITDVELSSSTDVSIIDHILLKKLLFSLTVSIKLIGKLKIQFLKPWIDSTRDYTVFFAK